MNRYTLWKYVVIAVALVIGIVYTLPNFFPEAPAVQVSTSKSNIKIDTSTLQMVEDALKGANIPYSGVSLEATTSGGSVVNARLGDPDTQLKARDALQEKLNPGPKNESYIVALSLLSTSPHALSWIHAFPMFLGLDLRGGVHFLEQVDMKAALDKAADRYLTDIRSLLREKRILYAGIAREGQTVAVRFRDPAERARAYQEISNSFPDLQLREVEGAGDSRLVAGLKPEAQKRIQEGAVQQNITILRNRVNERGVAEPIIQQRRAHIQGSHPRKRRQAHGDRARRKGQGGGDHRARDPRGNRRWQGADQRPDEHPRVERHRAPDARRGAGCANGDHRRAHRRTLARQGEHRQGLQLGEVRLHRAGGVHLRVLPPDGRHLDDLPGREPAAARRHPVDATGDAHSAGYRRGRAHARHGHRRQRADQRAHPGRAPLGRHAARCDPGRLRTRVEHDSRLERDHAHRRHCPADLRHRPGARLRGRALPGHHDLDVQRGVRLARTGRDHLRRAQEARQDIDRPGVEADARRIAAGVVPGTWGRE